MSPHVSKALHTTLSGLFLPGPGRLIFVSSSQIMEKWSRVSGVVELSTPSLLNLYFRPLKRKRVSRLGTVQILLAGACMSPLVNAKVRFFT